MKKKIIMKNGFSFIKFCVIAVAMVARDVRLIAHVLAFGQLQTRLLILVKEIFFFQSYWAVCLDLL